MPIDEIKTALDRSVEFARRAKAGFGETALVRGLFRAGIPYLRRTLPSAMAARGWRISIAGLFCHGGTFQVRLRSNRKCCEIGDLLIVVRNQTATRPRNTALLLQAKLQARGSRPSPVQRELYAAWPTFEWRYGWLSEQGSRSVTGAPHRGAQYAYLKPPPTSPTSHLLRSGATPPEQQPLATGLAAALLGIQGRQFREYRDLAASIGWSRVVWDMIDATAASASQAHRRLGRGLRVFRFGSLPTFLLEAPGGDGLLQVWSELPVVEEADDPDDIDDGPPSVPRAREGFRDDDPGGAISIVEILIDTF